MIGGGSGGSAWSPASTRQLLRYQGEVQPWTTWRIDPPLPEEFHELLQRDAARDVLELGSRVEEDTWLENAPLRWGRVMHVIEKAEEAGGGWD